MLTFQEVNRRVVRWRDPQRHWLIRITHPLTKDGMYTIGKIIPARLDRQDGTRPQGWCLSLNQDVDLSMAEVSEVYDFMQGRLVNGSRAVDA